MDLETMKKYYGLGIITKAEFHRNAVEYIFGTDDPTEQYLRACEIDAYMDGLDEEWRI